MAWTGFSVSQNLNVWHLRDSWKSQTWEVGSHLLSYWRCHALVTRCSAVSRTRFSTCCGDRGFTLFTACCPGRMPSGLWVGPCLKEENARLQGSPEKCRWMQVCSALSCAAPSCSTRFESTGRVSRQRADLKDQCRFCSKASIFSSGNPTTLTPPDPLPSLPLHHPPPFLRTGYPDHMVFSEFRRRFDVLAPHLTKKHGRNYIVKDEKRVSQSARQGRNVQLCRCLQLRLMLQGGSFITSGPDLSAATWQRNKPSFVRAIVSI